MYKNLKWIDEIKKYFLFLFMIAVFFMLLFRNFGIYPVVFGDEYSYSLFSRIQSLKDAPIPYYLYLAIYKKTNYCGDGFLGCARILNSFFFVAAAPFIYSIARQVCTKNLALFITLIALLSPVNSYTAYYMPEALYYFSFWLFTWFVLRLDAASGVKDWCLAGELLGAASLVKFHALFLIPALIVYVFYINRQKPWKQSFISAGFFIVTALLTKFIIAYVLAGKAGLTFFGTTYTSIAGSAVSNAAYYWDLLKLALINIKGHLLMISAIFGVAIAAALNLLRYSGEIKPAQRMAFYGLAIWITLLPLIGFFAASTVNYGPYESIGRLSFRYYNFIFPLFFIITASQFSVEGSFKYRAVIAFIIGATLIYAVFRGLNFYIPSYVDGPELAAFLNKKSVFYSLSFLSLSALMLWAYSPSRGAKLYMYLMVPLFILYSMYYIHQQIRLTINPNIFDKAGIFARSYLPHEERSKVLVVGSHLAGLYRSMFYLDNEKVSFEALTADQKYDFSKTPKDKNWVLMIGDHMPEHSKLTQIAMDGYTLVHM